MRIILLALCLALLPTLAAADQPFEDKTWRRCVEWMLDGTRGALLENQCVEYFNLPPPSLFQCARKVRLGYKDVNDRESCAIIFELWARKAREGYLK